MGLLRAKYRAGEHVMYCDDDGNKKRLEIVGTRIGIHGRTYRCKTFGAYEKFRTIINLPEDKLEGLEKKLS